MVVVLCVAIVCSPLSSTGIAALKEDADTPSEKESSHQIIASKEQELKEKEAALGSEHPEVVSMLTELCLIYNKANKFAEASQCYKRAVMIQEKVYGKEHRLVAQSLYYLGQVSFSLGHYVEAEHLFKDSMRIQEKILIKEGQIDLARTMGAYGNMLYFLGRYAEAETLIKRALAINTDVFEREHPRVAANLWQLGNLYHYIEQYKEAESLYKESLEIRLKTLGNNHLDVAASWRSLGWLYWSVRRHAEAEEVLKKALEIQEKHYKEENPTIATTLSNLALVYLDTRRYTEAEQLNTRGLKIREQFLGNDHPLVAQTLNNLGLCFYRRGQFRSAEPFLERALAIRKKVFGDAHKLVANSSRILAQIFGATKRHRKAHEHFKYSLSVIERYKDNAFSLLTEQQKLHFMETNSKAIKIYMSHTLFYINEYERAVMDTLDAWIRWKGAVTEAQGRHLVAAMMSGDPKLSRQFDELMSVRREIARLQMAETETVPSEELHQILADLEKKRDSLERSLNRESREFAMEKLVGTANATRIAEILPKDSVYIDFARVPLFNFKRRTFDPPCYVAFILLPGSHMTVKLVDISEAKEIDQHINAYVEEMHLIKRFGILPRHEILKREAQALYQLIIKRIEPYLKDKKHLFISPDSMLSLIPFEILTDGEGRYLFEEFRISYIATGRDILRFTDTHVAEGSPLLMADPDFDGGVHKGSTTPDDGRITASGSTIIQRGVKGLHFTRLPDTKLEADHIEKILRAQYKRDVMNYQWDRAREEVLFSVQSPRLLHIATHGYFLGDNRKESTDEGDQDTAELTISGLSFLENPMLRSGFVLAGVNASLKKGHDNGLVSAEKVLGLRLRGTDMVVLSACETGLGEVKTSEGVFGLQRAFILSGAKTLVMSLWSVPSKETTELMSRFYTLLSEGKRKAEALRVAKLEMMKRKPNPFFWGGFILIGRHE